MILQLNKLNDTLCFLRIRTIYFITKLYLYFRFQHVICINNKDRFQTNRNIFTEKSKLMETHLDALT